MTEDEAAARLNRGAQHVVVGGERLSHAIGVRLPPTGRTLHIGEQNVTTTEGAAVDQPTPTENLTRDAVLAGTSAKPARSPSRASCQSSSRARAGVGPDQSACEHPFGVS